MKSTGITRKLDNLGRIVLPIELRNTFDIDIRDALEVYTDKEMIILKKYSPGCVFCGNMKELKNFKGKHVCSMCIAEADH